MTEKIEVPPKPEPLTREQVVAGLYSDIRSALWPPDDIPNSLATATPERAHAAVMRAVNAIRPSIERMARLVDRYSDLLERAVANNVATMDLLDRVQKGLEDSLEGEEEKKEAEL